MEALLDKSRFSGELWPAHLKPKDDEILTSWLVRLALAHGLMPHTFKSWVWPELRYLWGIEIDRTTDERILQELAEKTGTSTLEVFSTTLSSYAERLHISVPLKGPVNWLMPINTNARKRQKRYGLQFCQMCLSEDKRPYFRRKWRLAFVFLCEKHGTLLLDHCPNCCVPINLYENGQVGLYKVGLNALVTCYECGIDFRNDSNHAYAVDAEEIRFQESLLSILEQGYADIPRHGQVFSCLYFEGLKQLARSICSGEMPLIREKIIDYYGITLPAPALSGKHKTIEIFRIPERRGLIAMLRRLIEDWPDGFINFCERNEVWQYVLFKHAKYLPFWYWSVIAENLNRSSYIATDQEFEAAIEHERKMGREPHTGTMSKYFPTRVCAERLRKMKLTKQGRKGLIGYPESVKAEAVRLYEEGKSFPEIAKALSVKSSKSVSNWIEKYLSAAD